MLTRRTLFGAAAAALAARWLPWGGVKPPAVELRDEAKFLALAEPVIVTEVWDRKYRYSYTYYRETPDE